MLECGEVQLWGNCLLILNQDDLFFQKEAFCGEGRERHKFDLKGSTWGPETQTLCPCPSPPVGGFGTQFAHLWKRFDAFLVLGGSGAIADKHVKCT